MYRSEKSTKIYSDDVCIKELHEIEYYSLDVQSPSNLSILFSYPVNARWREARDKGKVSSFRAQIQHRVIFSPLPLATSSGQSFMYIAGQIHRILNEFRRKKISVKWFVTTLGGFIIVYCKIFNPGDCFVKAVTFVSYSKFLIILLFR